MKVCRFCSATAKQSQTEQLSKSRMKFLATTYKPFFRALYTLVRSVSSMSRKASLPSRPREGRGKHPPTQRIVNAFPFPLTLAIVIAPVRAMK